jgi:hypothetical protein
MDLVICGALASCVGHSGTPHANVPEPTPPAPASAAAAAAPARPGAGTPAETCIAVMHRTRGCAEVYVPGLLALRVHLDQPPGIAERLETEGRDAMIELAHSQFSRDWSDEAISRNCKALSEKPAAVQERIVAPDRRCLEMTECSAFTRCDLAHKEKRWTENP